MEALISVFYIAGYLAAVITCFVIYLFLGLVVIRLIEIFNKRNKSKYTDWVEIVILLVWPIVIIIYFIFEFCRLFRNIPTYFMIFIQKMNNFLP
jgi:hypothetical protein